MKGSKVFSFKTRKKNQWTETQVKSALGKINVTLKLDWFFMLDLQSHCTICVWIFGQLWDSPVLVEFYFQGLSIFKSTYAFNSGSYQKLSFFLLILKFLIFILNGVPTRKEHDKKLSRAKSKDCIGFWSI